MAQSAPGQIPGQVLPGQLGRGSSYPSQQYYFALELYRDGDLVNAAEAFDRSLGQARVDSRGRWIDSIPALAMLGECHWQLGNLQMAMSNIDAALELVIQHRGWLSRVDFSNVLGGGVRAPDSNSGWAGTAGIQLLPIPTKLSVQRGELLTEQRLAQGGTIETPNNVSMDVPEVLRTIAVALHRRRLILGELSKTPQVPAEVLEATKYPQNLQIPMARTLIGSVRAIGRYADLDDARVLTEAPSVAVMNGGIHPITPIVLLCHAETISQSARPSDAVPIALQAVKSAAALGHTEWVGEALQLAVGCSEPAMIANVRNSATGAAGAYNNRTSFTTLASLLVAAEAAILTGESSAAGTLLQRAQGITNGRGFTQPRLTAYGAYVTALLGAASGQSIEGSANGSLQSALTAVKAFNLNQRIRNKPVISNPSLYQLTLVLNSTQGGALDRQSEDRLRYHNGRPPDSLWRRDPVEALGWLMQDRTMTSSLLLGAAASSSDPKQLLLASDEYLRRTFEDALPIGGRLQCVRTLATVDPARLDKSASELLKQPPAHLASLRQAAGQVEQGALATPTTADLLYPLESSASFAALLRQGYPDVILPAIQLDDVKTMPPRTGLVVFTISGNRVIATLASSDTMISWVVGDLGRVSNSVGQLLKEIGVGGNRAARLTDDKPWRTMAAEFRRQLLADTSFDAAKFDDLIVVPSGPLWYLPIEMLPAGGEDAELIGDKIRIRYAPTPGLALRPAPLAPRAIEGEESSGDTAISADLFFAPRDHEVNTEAVEQIVEVTAPSILLPQTPPQPSGWLSPSVRRLVVVAPRAIDPTRALAFAPTKEDGNRYEGSLAGWLAFPNHSPTSVVLPGLRTPVGAGRLGDGSELFMTLTALHAAGTRDILLSRWAVGGQSTSLLMREFLQELPHAGMQGAWQRAKLLLRDAELIPESEPLLGSAQRDLEKLTGDTPLFWAGYLVDAPSPMKAKN